MKKAIIHILLISLAALCLSGCNHLRQTPAAPTLPGATSNSGPAPEPQLSARYHYLQSLALRRQKQIEAATTALEKAIAADPESSLLRRELIRLYLEQGQKETALNLAETLVSLDPEDVDNLLMLVRLIKDSKQQNQFRHLLLQILGLDPENKETYLRLGRIYLENQWYPDALDLFSQMTEHLPEYYVAHFYLGEAHSLSGNYKLAEKAFLKTIELEPDLVEPRFRLMDIALEKSAGTDEIDREKILGLYEQILDIEPGNTSLLLRLGEVQGEAGLKDDCIATMKEVIRIDPENASALNYLGYTYADLGIHLDEAESLIKKAMGIKPDDGYITDSMGWVYFQQGKYETAVFYLERAAELTEFEPIIASHLADAYVKTGRLANAMEAYHKALANAMEKDADLVSEVEKKIKDLKRQLHAPTPDAAASDSDTP